MKIATRLICCILTLLMLVSCAACSKKKVTEIYVGGDCGTISLSDDTALGVYEKVKKPKWFVTEKGCTYEYYYSEKSDTPYIIVIKDTAYNQYTLEEYTAADAKTWGDGFYQIYEDGGTFGYYTTVEDTPEGFFYTENNVVKLDDCFKTVVFYAKTEEVRICDSNLYIYLPAGYKDVNDEEQKNMFKACLEAKYDDSYYFPTVFISYDIVDYEHDKNFYSTVFDEFNITEEEYNKLAEEWSYEDTLKFLSQIGYTVLTSENLDINGINVEIFRLTCDGKDAKFEDHLYISEDGEQYYFIDAFTQLTDPYPTAGYGIMKSIHKKQQ